MGRYPARFGPFEHNVTSEDTISELWRWVQGVSDESYYEPSTEIAALLSSLDGGTFPTSFINEWPAHWAAVGAHILGDVHGTQQSEQEEAHEGRRIYLGHVGKRIHGKAFILTSGGIYGSCRSIVEGRYMRHCVWHDSPRGLAPDRVSRHDSIELVGPAWLPSQAWFITKKANDGEDILYCNMEP